MKTLDEVKGQCRIEEVEGSSPHWIWCGGLTNQTPRIWAPDYTKTKKRLKEKKIASTAGPVMASQPGRRAAYHLSTGKALPSGWRVFATCDEPACVIHFGAGSAEKTGQKISESGKLKHSIQRKLANRAICRANSKINADMIREITQSTESGIELSRRLGISQTTVSKVRVHGSPAHQPLVGFFSGLGARAAA